MAGKILKRIMAVTLSAGMVIGFAGCSESASKDSQETAQNQGEADDKETEDSDKTDSNKNDSDGENSTEETTKAEVSFLEHNVPYVNEEGLENGDLTFLLRNLGEMEFDKSYMVTYKSVDKNVNAYLYHDVEDDGPISFYEIVDTCYAGHDSVAEAYIVDTVNDNKNRITIEVTTAAYCETAEEYAKKNGDARDDFETYYVGDYYVVMHNLKSNMCRAYKYIDKMNIIVMTTYYEDGFEYKDFFNGMLERISIEEVEGTAALTGADKGYALDRFASILAEEYSVYIKDYRYVKEFDEYEFIYETEDCEYKIKADNDTSFKNDLEKGKYVLEIEYADGIGLYRTDIERKFSVVNTNTGRKVDIYMDCDLETSEEKIELLRKELLK